jgi:hypothetical protein
MLTPSILTIIGRAALEPQVSVIVSIYRFMFRDPRVTCRCCHPLSKVSGITRMKCIGSLGWSRRKEDHNRIDFDMSAPAYDHEADV